MKILTAIILISLLSGCRQGVRLASGDGAPPHSDVAVHEPAPVPIPEGALAVNPPEETAHESVTYISPASEYTAIGWQEAALVTGVMEKWLGYYGLDIGSAVLEEEREFDLWQRDDPLSVWYLEFTDQDDRGDLPGYDYSPDRMRYIDTGGWLFADGRFSVDGWDDSQNVYIYDRRYRTVKLAAWTGALGVIDGAFWIDDKKFILAGSDLYYYHHFQKASSSKAERVHFFNIYDIPGRTVRKFVFFPSGRDSSKRAVILTMSPSPKNRPEWIPGNNKPVSGYPMIRKAGITRSLSCRFAACPICMLWTGTDWRTAICR